MYRANRWNLMLCSALVWAGCQPTLAPDPMADDDDIAEQDDGADDGDDAGDDGDVVSPPKRDASTGGRQADAGKSGPERDVDAGSTTPTEIEADSGNTSAPDAEVAVRDAGEEQTLPADGGGQRDGSAAPDAMMPSVKDPGTEGDGDHVAGPTYALQDALKPKGNPAGRSFSFTMDSSKSKYFTGLDKTLNSPKTFTRRIDVYIPAQYEDGTPAPVMILQDGGGTPFALTRMALDNLTIERDPTRRLPAFIAIAVANGGGDGKGSQRGLEYDTMSDRYAKFISEEVLPAVVAHPQIKAAYPKLAFTSDPEGRATLGCSSGGAAAVSMAWFAPQLFRRVIAYSTTLVDQQDDDAPEERMYPLGAWEYHSGLKLIANSPVKPVRMFINVNDRDLGFDAPESGHHNWVMANQRTASALKAKNYHYRYVFGRGAGHCARGVYDATMADALLWVWRGYEAP